MFAICGIEVATHDGALRFGAVYCEILEGFDNANCVWQLCQAADEGGMGTNIGMQVSSARMASIVACIWAFRRWCRK